MKKLAPARRLDVRRETIRALQAVELVAIVGGGPVMLYDTGDASCVNPKPQAAPIPPPAGG